MTTADADYDRRPMTADRRKNDSTAVCCLLSAVSRQPSAVEKPHFNLWQNPLNVGSSTLGGAFG